ncbi:unnamed protein product [Penicillium olsonii]|nr:unnamed protein product [Penicillium olsonii]
MSVIFNKITLEKNWTMVLTKDIVDLVLITNHHREKIIENIEKFTKLRLRVLALVYRPYTTETQLLKDTNLNREDVESNLYFLGLIDLYDPPHSKTTGLIQVYYQADALPTLSLVITRYTPQTKVCMINALHRRSWFITMTGDRVNNSLSLKYTDIGITIGQTDSDIAKNTSDIILTDDNFTSILNTVEEGRRIFNNIQKFILYLLSENIAQVYTLLIGLAFKDIDNQSIFPLSLIEIL